MKLTRIKKQGQALTEGEMMGLIQTIKTAIKTEGFISEVNEVNSRSLKIGLRMRSFNVDTTIHGRNLQKRPYNCKLTNLPTWEQRVVYNNVINKALDMHNIDCKVVSGPYIIRDGTESMTEADWHDQKPDWVYSNESKGYIVVSVDEKQYLIEKKEKQKLNAAKKRLAAKMKTEV